MTTERHNRYPADCDTCAQAIPPDAGILINAPPNPKTGRPRWKVRCATCAAKAGEANPPEDHDHEALPFYDENDPRAHMAADRRAAANGILVIRFSSGAVMTQNARGRCEDAPCCGCCT